MAKRHADDDLSNDVTKKQKSEDPVSFPAQEATNSEQDSSSCANLASLAAHDKTATTDTKFPSTLLARLRWREVEHVGRVIFPGPGRWSPETCVDCPDIAVRLKEEVERLQSFLRRTCRDYQMNKEPDWALTRWLMVQKLCETGGDPLLPYHAEIDSGLWHELVKSVSEVVATKICRKLATEATSCAQELRSFVSRHKHTSCEKSVAEDKTDTIVLLKHDSCSFTLNRPHYDRLEQEFKGNKSTLVARLFLLVCRYETLSGPGYQGAVPPAVWSVLQHHLQTSHECFASPLNHTLPSFTSAYTDTDVEFGSQGSFFNFSAKEGSFEANPPFIEEIMYAMALKIDNLLKQAEGPMSFVIILPAWDDTPAYAHLLASPFYNRTVVFRKRKHVYIDGFQHRAKNQIRQSQADSFVVFLQNDAGAAKWPISDMFLRELQSAFEHV
eukprot:GILK01006854.1.p1 GENE.GILK01006854.1~~GILK01006854.1.p1  ORF type:complete len:453 (-),score=67.01 GILK01006854.1:276-1598(-)